MPKIEREREITHPPGYRAIRPFEMLSPGDNEYRMFMARWLARKEGRLKEHLEAELQADVQQVIERRNPKKN